MGTSAWGPAQGGSSLQTARPAKPLGEVSLFHPSHPWALGPRGAPPRPRPTLSPSAKRSQAQGAWSKEVPALLRGYACGMPPPWVAGPRAPVSAWRPHTEWGAAGLLGRTGFVPSAAPTALALRAQAPRWVGWDSALGVGAGAGQVWGASGGPSASSLWRVTWGGLDRLASPCPWGGCPLPFLSVETSHGPVYKNVCKARFP